MSVVSFTKEAGNAIGASLKPKRYDVEIYQGDTFVFYLTLSGTGLNVTGWTAVSQIKKKSDSTLVADAVTVSAVDPDLKRFAVTIDSEKLTPGTEYMYDIQVNDGTNKRTFIGGIITVWEDITEL